MDWTALRALRQAWVAEVPQGPACWSLVEHPLWPGAQDAIAAWAQEGLQAHQLDFLGDARRPSLVMDLGFALLLRFVQVAQAQANEVGLWPLLAEEAFPPHLSAQLFTPLGVPRPPLYAALKQTFTGTRGLRHAFGFQAPQRWELSLRLQFGPTQQGWASQGFAWLHGALRPRVLQALLGEWPDAEHLCSPSLRQLWAALLGGRSLNAASPWLDLAGQRTVLALTRKAGGIRGQGALAAGLGDEGQAEEERPQPWQGELLIHQGALRWALRLEAPEALPPEGGQVWVGRHAGPRWWAEGGQTEVSSPTWTWTDPEPQFALRWGQDQDMVELLPATGSHRLWDLEAQRPVDLAVEGPSAGRDYLLLAAPGLLLVADEVPRRVAWGHGQAWHLAAPWSAWALHQEGAVVAECDPSRPQRPPAPQWAEPWHQDGQVATPGGRIALRCHSKQRIRKVALGASVASAHARGSGQWEVALDLPARWTQRGIPLRVMLEDEAGCRWSAPQPWHPELAQGLALLGPQAWTPWPAERTVPDRALRLGHWWSPRPEAKGHLVLAEGGAPLAAPQGDGGTSCQPLALAEPLAWLGEADAPGQARPSLSVGVVDAGLLHSWQEAEGAWALPQWVDRAELSLWAWGPDGPALHPLRPATEGDAAWLRPSSPEVAQGPCLLEGSQGCRVGLHLPQAWPEALLLPEGWPSDDAALAGLATLRRWSFPFSAHPHLMRAWASHHPLAWLQAFLEGEAPRVASGGARWEERVRHRARLWVEATLWALPVEAWVSPLLAVAPPALAAFCAACPALSARAWAYLLATAPPLARQFGSVVQWGWAQCPWGDAGDEAPGAGAWRGWNAWRDQAAFPHADPFGDWPWAEAVSEGRAWATQPERASPHWGGPSAPHPAQRAQLLRGLLQGHRLLPSG